MNLWQRILGWVANRPNLERARLWRLLYRLDPARASRVADEIVRGRPVPDELKIALFGPKRWRR